MAIVLVLFLFVVGSVSYSIYHRIKYSTINNTFNCFVSTQKNGYNIAFMKFRAAQCKIDGQQIFINYLHDQQETVVFDIIHELSSPGRQPIVHNKRQCAAYEIYTGFGNDKALFEYYWNKNHDFHIVEFFYILTLVVPYGATSKEIYCFQNGLESIRKLLLTSKRNCDNQ